jgi:hypothetical protein
MTDFQIFALVMPIVGTVFVGCFAYVLTRIDRVDADGEGAPKRRTQTDGAAE